MPSWLRALLGKAFASRLCMVHLENKNTGTISTSDRCKVIKDDGEM